LDDLDAGILAVPNPEARRDSDLWEAECPVARLVEDRNETDIEGGGIVASKAEIDIHKGPRVSGSDLNGAAVYGPQGTVVVRPRLVDGTA
jgi:hypothetical protein